ncbi:MAG: cysteine--tRNA ligase [Eggerthellaceae bacterium]|nr:cysteine--tRNA ligase [Eggerthellaceae bacterium]
MKIYDTKERRKVELIPEHKEEIRLYICGPTVYDRIHIGNARTFISFDTIRRYLMWKGYAVTFVQNLTDIDDKIIARANEEDMSPEEISKKYSDYFIQDMAAAGVLTPDIQPRATREIGTMINLIARIIEKGHAYEVDGDVYFSVRSYSQYGALSGRNIDDLEEGHRKVRSDIRGTADIIKDRKKDPLDFAVWKAAKPGEPSWGSPWGQGRPGWHIECSAMSEKYLGLPFDIHGGGADLIFPHHENEIAQSQSCCCCNFANYWMHGGMLQVTDKKTGETEKMSKSLNNFLLLHEVLEQVDRNTLRMLFLLTHYRSPFVFGEKSVTDASASLNRLVTTVQNALWSVENFGTKVSAENNNKLLKDIELTRLKFQESMDDDFNTAEAMGHIFGLANKINSASAEISGGNSWAIKMAAKTIIELCSVLGIELEERFKVFEIEEDKEAFKQLAVKLIDFDKYSEQDVFNALIEARAQARKEKNWDLADAIRDEVEKLNYTIEDTSHGTRISKN